MRSGSCAEYEGLWTKCSFGHDASSLTCKAYLDPAPWSARYFITLSLVAWITSLVSIQCARPDSARCCLVGAACLHLVASLTTLIPVSWTALIIFHADRGLSSIRFHMGEAVCRLAGLVFAMHGWAVAVLFWPLRQGRRRNHHGWVLQPVLDTLFSSASLDSHTNACVRRL